MGLRFSLSFNFFNKLSHYYSLLMSYWWSMFCYFYQWYSIWILLKVNNWHILWPSFFAVFKLFYYKMSYYELLMVSYYDLLVIEYPIIFIRDTPAWILILWTYFVWTICYIIHFCLSSCMYSCTEKECASFIFFVMNCVMCWKYIFKLVVWV